MIRMRTFGKRCLAMLMAMLMLFSSVNNGFLQLAVASAAEKESITDGELLAQNYELSDGEKALLTSGLLREDTYTYEVKPAAEDDLVEVNPETKKITAKSFAHKGFVWYPKEAVVINGDDRETVALEESAGVYVGTFETEGNTYSVQVTYELHIQVETAKQEQLLQAGANLKQGLDNLDKLAQLEAMLDTKIADRDVTGRELLVQVIEGLMTWANGLTSPMFPLTFYYPGLFYADADKAAPVKALYEQLQNNEGNLDLFVLLNEYSTAYSKSQYLMENGQALLDKAAETAGYLQLILNEQNTVLTTIGNAEGMGITMPFTTEDLEEFYKSIGYVLNGVNSDTLKFAGLNAITGTPLAVLQNNPLKADMTALDYKMLDTLAKNLPATATNVTVTEKLLADTAVVQVNMNRYDITVKVVANVVELNSFDSAALKNLVSDKTALITMNKGASYADVWAEILNTGVITDALAGWNEAYQVGDDFYTNVVTGMSQNQVLEEDLEITITYTPKNYTISGVEGLPTSVPYGYNLVLPKHENDGLVYDYEIGGELYRQNTSYRVVSNTQIIRSEGEVWQDPSWGEAVSHVVSDKAAAVLKSSALNTGILAIRNPAMAGCITLTTNPDGSTNVAAVSAASGVKNLSWVPARAYYVIGANRYPIANFVNGAGSFHNADYDKVEVEYTLALNGIISDDALLAVLNLPGVLAGQAKNQKTTMNKLSNMKGSLQELGKNIKMLELLMEGNTLTDEGKAALSILINDCYNTQTKQVYLYEYLLAYEESGLAWYYAGNNFETFQAEFDKLKKAMNDFLDAEQDLQGLLEDVGYGDKYDMVDGVRNDLNSVVLLAPHASIIRTSTNEQLTDLVAAIEKVSADEIYTVLPEIERTVVRDRVADNKRSITVKLWVDGKETGAFSQVLVVGNALKQEHLDALLAALGEMDSSLTIDKRFYTYTSGQMPQAGLVMSQDLVVNYTYQSKEIDVAVEGVGSIGSITIHQGTIILPACGQEGYRYQYVLNGKVIDTYNEAVNRDLTMEEKLFFLNGGKIQRKTINVVRQDLLDFIASLNDGLIKAGTIGVASFVPVEDAQGNISIVLKVSPLAKGFDPMGVGMTVIQSLVGSSYSYMDLGGYPLRTGASFHLQGILDALLNSGFTLSDVEKALNADGTINNMVLNGQTVITDGIDMSRVPNVNALGGLLIETDLDLATSEAGNRTHAKLYITLSDDGTNAGTFKTLDNGLAKVTPYVNIHLVGGNANLVLNLPDKAYQAYLAAMMATGNIDLGNVNSLDYEDSITYLYDLIKPLLEDDTISSETFENTLGAVGKDVDLQGTQKVLDLIHKVLNHIHSNVQYSNMTVVGNVYSQDIAYPADNLLNRLPIPGTLLDIIAEKGGNLEATLGVQLKNLDTKYEALVIDLKASGVNKADFVTDLQATLNKIHDNAVVILVEDVTGNIVCNKKIYLDLNGKTVNGDILGSKITLMDSTIGNLGQVNGSFNGSDIRNNNLYTTVVDGDNINVYLNTGFLAQGGISELKNIALDLALELVLNYYTTAALSLDGDVIYSVDMGDVIGIIQNGGSYSINQVIDVLKCDGLSNFTNKFLNDITDFAALAEAIKNNDKLLSYTVGTKAWNVSISHEKEKDYITGGIVPNANEKVETLNILLSGTAAEKETLYNLLAELGKVVDSNIHVELKDIHYADRVVSVAGSASASVVVDTKGNHDYAVALAILLAADRKDNANIIAALETYFTEGKVAPLKNVIDNTTVAQLFSAIKKLNRSTNFAALAAGLGLDSVNTIKAVELLNNYRPIIITAAKALRGLEVTGTNTKMSAYATNGEVGSYDLSKELKKAGTIKVLGYDVAVDVSLKVTLFNVEPSFDGYQPEISVTGPILAGKFENEQIILDADADGITAEQFAQLIIHGAANADKVEVKFDAEDLVNGKVVNGATVEFIASNSSTSVVDRVTYTVIILGDVNSDGTNSVSDSVALMLHVMKEHDLSAVVGAHALLAADMNQSQSLSVSDAVMIMRKCMKDNYISELN